MMTYFSSPNIDLTGFLRYYSPMAMVLNRFYYVLICFVLVATINKCVPGHRVHSRSRPCLTVANLNLYALPLHKTMRFPVLTSDS